jgi:hypothetical protein
MLKKKVEGLVCSTEKQEIRRTVRLQREWNEGRGGGQAGWNGMEWDRVNQAWDECRE